MSLTLVCLIAIGVTLAGCTPSPKLPVTDEVKLDVVRKGSHDIHLKLRNQTAKRISFFGVRDWWWEDVFPQGPQFECVLSDSHQIQDSPYPLIDGPAWKKFVIESGEEIGIVVGNPYLDGSDAKLATGQCKFVLHLEGDAVVKSEEF